MRFFSNEAKENTDTTDDNDTDRPDHVQSDPVAVPHQRAGSPWSDAPGSPDTATQSPDSSDFSDSTDGELAEQELRDGTDESLRTDDSEVRHDGDDLVRDPDALATDTVADGATDAGTDAVTDERADDQPFDLPLDDQPVDLPLDDRHETDVETHDEDAPADSLDGATTTYGPDGTVQTVDEPAAEDDAVLDDAAANDTVVDDTVTTDDTAEDAVAEDAVTTDDTASDAVVDDTVTTDDTAEDAVAEDVAVADEEPAAAEDVALKDEGEFDSPAVVEPATGEALDAAETDTGADREIDGVTPAVVEEESIVVATIPVPDEEIAKDTDEAVPVASTSTPTGDKPGSVAAPGGLDRLFPDGDSFAERFREVQLRFVDSPKEATAEAATLIDEAIDNLAATLKAQKDGLATDSDDTEQLRVALRAYRDVLNRLTAL